MKNPKENFLFIVALIGGVADVFAIAISVKSLSLALPLLIGALILLLSVIVFLYSKYRERRYFISFIQYLFDNPEHHNFNLLPKICLALDKSKES